MQNHYRLSDLEFKSQFEHCQLDPKDFSHEAHLRLAWIHINDHGVIKARTNIQEQLRTFVAFAGARDKYNTTLTVAAVHMVHHFMQRSTTNNFIDFINRYPQLNTDFKDLILSHYSMDVFNMEEAKERYITPDLLPFD